MTETQKEHLKKIYENLKINLKPKGLTGVQMELWKELIFNLVRAWDYYLIKEERIHFHLNTFLQLDLKAQILYLEDIKERVNKSIDEFLETIGEIKIKQLEEKLDKIKSQTDKVLHPFIEYFFYSYINGTKVEEDEIEQFEQLASLTPEQKQQLHELELAKKLSKMRSSKGGFRASDLDVDTNNGFNQVFDEEMVAQLIEKSQPKPSQPIVPTKTKNLNQPKNHPQNIRQPYPKPNQPNFIANPNQTLPNQATSQPNFNPQPNQPSLAPQQSRRGIIKTPNRLPHSLPGGQNYQRPETVFKPISKPNQRIFSYNNPNNPSLNQPSLTKGRFLKERKNTNPPFNNNSNQAIKPRQNRGLDSLI